MEEQDENIIKIGTRKSKLALIQTDIVKDKIKQAFPELEVEIVKIDTKETRFLISLLHPLAVKEYLLRNLKQNFFLEKSILRFTVRKICRWISRKV